MPPKIKTQFKYKCCEPASYDRPVTINLRFTAFHLPLMTPIDWSQSHIVMHLFIDL